MKLITRSLSLLTLASLALFFTHCGGDDGEKASKEKDQLNKLSKTWVLGTVTFSDADGHPEQIGEDFELTIGGTYNSEDPEGPYTYSTTDTEFPSPWDSSGEWEFIEINTGNSGLILRDDDTTISYTIASNGNLTLTFNFSGTGHGARNMSVGGDWMFVLEPK